MHKSKILLIIILILFIFLRTSFSQNAYYNAQYLALVDPSELKLITESDDELKEKLVSFSKLEKKEIKNLIEFLNSPFSDEVKKIDFPIVIQTINKYNQYVLDRKKYEETILSNPVFARSLGYNPALSANVSTFGVIPSLIGGNLSLSDSMQTNIIDGLTKYYAEEFKKAQTVTYLQVFETTAGKLGELQILFPETYNKLQNADPSKFPDLGNEYKKIFNYDLKNAWPNLLNYIENYPTNALPDNSLTILKGKNLTTIRNHKAYYQVKISSEIISKLIENQHPVDVLNSIDLKYYDEKMLKETSLEAKIANVIHGINLIQSNLRDSTKAVESSFNNVWLNTEQLKLLNTNKKIKLFFGLLYQQDRIYIKNMLSEFGVDVDNLDTKTQKLEEFYNTKIYPIIGYLKTIEEAGKSYSKNNEFEILVKYLDANMKLINDYNVLSDENNVDIYFNTSKNLVYIYSSIKKSDYSNLTYYITNVLNDFIEDNSEYQNTIFKIEEYGSFMAEIINAENSDDVKETITKFAAPPSSFILKRTHKHTVSITGQPGYFASTEVLIGQDYGRFVTGITLPMGIEYTFKPISDLNKTHGSIGFFFQLIDIGAVLNFRIDDETSELPDQVTFEQIVSPGFSLTYGFKNSPVTIALGYQYTPELRKITNEGGNEVYAKGNRFFGRVGWDIPLINLYRSKNR